MRTFMRLLIFILIPLTWACADFGVAGPLAPSRPTTCVNALDPASFVVFTETGERSPRMTNAYLQPLTSRDSIPTKLKDGRDAWLVFGFASNYCVTRLDSMRIHAGTVGYEP